MFTTLKYKMMVILFLTSFLVLQNCLCQKYEKFSLMENDKKMKENLSLEKLLLELLFRVEKLKCIAFIFDDFYYEMLSKKIFRKFGVRTTFFINKMRKNQTSSDFYEESEFFFKEINSQQCDMYVLFISNGTNTLDFLLDGHNKRLINTRANMILLYDKKLFSNETNFIWKIIINVIFIRKHEMKRFHSHWYDLSTVPFPYTFKKVLIPTRIDIWKNGKLKIGARLFYDKTKNLKNQILKAATFPHIPATDKVEITRESNKKTGLTSGTFEFKGTEIEIVKILSKMMNFTPHLYEPVNASESNWGSRKDDGTFDGILGELTKYKADFALGDLQNSRQNLEVIDLTVPYNTECLTFLTPVALTDNSWMTLILPFKLYMWLCILVSTCTLGLIFHALAKFYYDFYENYQSEQRSVSNMSIMTDVSSNRMSSVKKIHTSYHDLKARSQHQYMRPKGLYIFGEFFNSLLYSFGMLLLISLPRFPSGWSLRMLTGWYSLYCSLVTVSYRASMTAILANPTPRITIDTLEQLERSGLTCVGWGSATKEFFLTLSDKTAQKIGDKFLEINDTMEAIDQVALGKFAFYENDYYLKSVTVQRQLDIEESKKTNLSLHGRKNRQLHIMENCVINMPISIGLQKNSPLKFTINKIIQKIIEAGFIRKWLDDVIQTTLNSEIFEENTQEIKALMNLQKFYSAFVALFIGYFLAICAAIFEKVYWRYKVEKHPFYNKHSRSVLYPKNFRKYQNLKNIETGPKFEERSFYKKFKGLKLLKK